MTTKKQLKILSKQEEAQLSDEEREAYYAELKAYLRSQRWKDYSAFQMKWREWANRLLIRRILRKVRKYDLIVDGCENIPQCPVIYAAHHAGVVDAENMFEAIPDHAVLLAGDDLDKLSRFLLGLNGTIFVTRLNRQSRNDSKTELLKSLSKGKSIIVFPEATWNLSPNKIHLPLTWGVVDMARKMNVPLVPVANEYFYDEKITDGKEHIVKVHIRFGKPVYVAPNDSLQTKLEEFDENFSSVRWSIWEENGISERKQISPMLYKNYIAGKISSFPIIGLVGEQKCIFGADDDFYQFHPGNIVPFDEDGAMLETTYTREQ